MKRIKQVSYRKYILDYIPDKGGGKKRRQIGVKSLKDNMMEKVECEDDEEETRQGCDVTTRRIIEKYR